MVARVKSLTTEKIDGNSYLFKIEFDGDNTQVMGTVARCASFLKCLPVLENMTARVFLDDDLRFEMLQYYPIEVDVEPVKVTMLGYSEKLYMQEVKRVYLLTTVNNYTFLLYTHD